MYDVTQLYTVMLERGFTVTGLAKKARMPQATAAQIFKRGSGHPDNIKKIARALGMELKDILILPKSRKTA